MTTRKRIRPTVLGDALELAPEDDALSLEPAMVLEPEPEPTGALTSPERSAMTTSAARTPIPQADEAFVDGLDEGKPLPPAWPIYLTAVAVAGLWSLGPIAFALGYRNAVAPLRDEGFAALVFSLLAVGPAVLVFFCAYMIRQGQRLSAEARRTRTMAGTMVAPALSAAARAGELARSVREEIVRAAESADEAREALTALREALAAETRQLVESTATSARTAHDLATTLGSERQELGALAATLDAQAGRVLETIQQQARMVTEATELADTQLHEAEGVLSARAADLAAAAGEASGAARAAGEDLTRHIARLESAGAGVAEQVRAVEGGLSEQRAALVALAGTLKADHEVFAGQAEAHASTLQAFVDDARKSSAELSDQAIKGGDSLRALIAAAAERFRDLAETARAEQDEFGQSTLLSLESVAEAAAEQRARLQDDTRAAIDALAAAAERSRAAAEQHTEAARDHIDQLSDAARSAGQQANQVFEARVAEARALVEQSTEMVDAAGAASVKRLEESAAAARATLSELQGMMAEIEQRAVRLPVAAKAQIELVRTSVAEGLADLADQARQTVEEAQAIDEAFQARARRNFEMLGEAVRLMGATAALPPAAAPSSLPPSVAPAAPLKPATRRERRPAPVADDDIRNELEALMEPQADPRPPEVEAGSEAVPTTVDISLRPRLKLTPTATDAEFSAVFEAAGGRAAEPAEGADGETWTWKDLLASIDGADAEGERLQDVLGAELADMGILPAKLLPKARIDEIAAAVQTGDGEGAREVVKRLAPAAVRRISRNLAADEPMRRQAQVYVRRYQTLVEDTAVRDPEGFLMANLLGDDAGRLYLLLDAAVDDAG